MRKLIINIEEEGISDEDALRRVLKVVEGGKISKNSNYEHYCWATSWSDGTRVTVKTKRVDTTDSFDVWKRK